MHEDKRAFYRKHLMAMAQWVYPAGVIVDDEGTLIELRPYPKLHEVGGLPTVPLDRFIKQYEAIRPAEHADIWRPHD